MFTPQLIAQADARNRACVDLVQQAFPSLSKRRFGFRYRLSNLQRKRPESTTNSERIDILVALDIGNRIETFPLQIQCKGNGDLNNGVPKDRAILIVMISQEARPDEIRKELRVKLHKAVRNLLVGEKQRHRRQLRIPAHSLEHLGSPLLRD